MLPTETPPIHAFDFLQDVFSSLTVDFPAYGILSAFELSNLN